MDRCLVSVTYTVSPMGIQEHCKWLATLNTHIHQTKLGQCKAAKLHQLMSMAASTAAMARPSCALTRWCACVCVFFRREEVMQTLHVCACMQPLAYAGHKKDFIHSSYEVSQRLTSRCSHSRLQPNVNRLKSLSLWIYSLPHSLPFHFWFRKFLSSIFKKFVCSLVMYPNSLTLLLYVLYYCILSIIFFDI